MTRVFDMHDPARRQAGLEAAVEAIQGGRLVGMPTETVYGLAADATNGTALARTFEAKGRPRFNPLIIHVDHLAVASRYGVISDEAMALASAFWPGPLTIVVPRREGTSVHDLATAGLDTIALRVPANGYARALIERTERPIAAPSANRSGRLSPTRASDVTADLGEAVDVVLDDGPTQIGIESTIVACIGGAPLLLRPGGIPRDALEAVLHRPLADIGLDDKGRPLSPGRLASHYAPRAMLRLDATRVAAGEAYLGFGDSRPDGPAPALRLDLSPSGDLREAAANLFSMLRRLDTAGADSVAVAPIPSEGLGEAIRDRLSRAAAPRSELARMV